MLLYLSPLTLGLILSLLALGVYISYRIFDFPDITVDGSFTTGAVFTLSAIQSGVNPVFATGLGMFGGLCAGSLTGLLQTRLKINKVLSGIVVMTALYSVNLFVMGGSAVVLMDQPTLKTYAGSIAAAVFSAGTIESMRDIILPPDSLVFFLMVLVIVVVVAYGLYAFLRTNIGLAIRASGENERMVRALGVNTNWSVVVGLALSNALVALSGALLAQEMDGTADLRLGIGMIANGLTSVIIGQVIAGKGRLNRVIIGVVLGSLVVRVVVSIIIGFGLTSDYFTLINAVFLVAVLAIPVLFKKGSPK